MSVVELKGPHGIVSAANLRNFAGRLVEVSEEILGIADLMVGNGVEEMSTRGFRTALDSLYYISRYPIHLRTASRIAGCQILKAGDRKKLVETIDGRIVGDLWFVVVADGPDIIQWKIFQTERDASSYAYMHKEGNYTNGVRWHRRSFVVKVPLDMPVSYTPPTIDPLELERGDVELGVLQAG